MPAATGEGSGAKAFSVAETLRDGRRVLIRALRPQDREPLVDALARASDRTLYTRFFGVRKAWSEREIDAFVEIDFVRHVALVAEIQRDGAPWIVGGARYVVGQPGEAEIAFAIVDDHQGLGLGTLLLRHLAAIAVDAGIVTFIADVLADNAAMLGVFRHSGFPMTTKRDGSELHLTLALVPRRAGSR